MQPGLERLQGCSTTSLGKPPFSSFCRVNINIWNVHHSRARGPTEDWCPWQYSQHVLFTELFGFALLGELFISFRMSKSWMTQMSQIYIYRHNSWMVKRIQEFHCSCRQTRRITVHEGCLHWYTFRRVYLGLVLHDAGVGFDNLWAISQEKASISPLDMGGMGLSQPPP